MKVYVHSTANSMEDAKKLQELDEVEFEKFKTLTPWSKAWIHYDRCEYVALDSFETMDGLKGLGVVVVHPGNVWWPWGVVSVLQSFKSAGLATLILTPATTVSDLHFTLDQRNFIEMYKEHGCVFEFEKFPDMLQREALAR